ncbi:NIF family HAD-type phosphatase [Marinobacter changyiensis]|uniref:NIF family HAD-type phosphatase n=1 Tax=Marinobacter changyiensis TaxID=2604091 RepID=UPI001264AB51|nr:NIF family HAD-type phosphatase [Marinobacter changyiensis]
MKKIILICLDIEGTLISNAVSQIPRPHLYHFLTEVNKLADLVLYTSVSPTRTRKIQNLFVDEGVVPDWFGKLDALHPIGTTKPKAVAASYAPTASRIFLVDDQEACIEEIEQDWWVAVHEYLPPYNTDDKELLRVLGELQMRCMTCSQLSNPS